MNPLLPDQANNAATRWLDGVMVVDLETSGLDARECGILSIAAVQPVTGAEFYMECRVRAGARIEAAALAVNGFTAEQAVDPMRTPEGFATHSFLQWLTVQCPRTRWILAGQNVGRFDHAFLTESAGSAYSPTKDGGQLFSSRVGHRTVDLHALAWAATATGRWPVPARGWTADAIFLQCALGEEPKPHHGLTGARMTATALMVLLGVLGRVQP